jgi:hypothetical protein
MSDTDAQEPVDFDEAERRAGREPVPVRRPDPRAAPFSPVHEIEAAFAARRRAESEDSGSAE